MTKDTFRPLPKPCLISKQQCRDRYGSLSAFKARDLDVELTQAMPELMVYPAAIRRPDHVESRSKTATPSITVHKTRALRPTWGFWGYSPSFTTDISSWS